MWREVTRQVAGETAFKPFAQGLFFDLAENPNYPLERIHSGVRAGRNTLIRYLTELQELGGKSCCHEPQGHTQTCGRSIARAGGTCAAAVPIQLIQLSETAILLGRLPGVLRQNR
jgi:hypothetical protein